LVAILKLERGTVYMSFLLVMPELAQSELEQYSRSSSTGQGQAQFFLFCEKHFTPECYVEGWLHEGTFNIFHKKHLKPGAIPIKLPKSTNDGNHTSPPPAKRPASKRRRLKSTRYFIIYTC